jgi:hypothetical protein
VHASWRNWQEKNAGASFRNTGGPERLSLFRDRVRQSINKFIEREIRERPTDLSEAGDFRAFIITRDGKDLTAEARQEAIRRIKRRMQKRTAVDFDLAQK